MDNPERAEKEPKGTSKRPTKDAAYCKNISSCVHLSTKTEQKLCSWKDTMKEMAAVQKNTLWPISNFPETTWMWFSFWENGTGTF